MNVYVTGIGVVSAIGTGTEETLQSLRSGLTGIRRSPIHHLMLGEVKMSDAQIVRLLALPDEDYSRTTLLGLVAAKEAWGNNKTHHQIRTGLISSTSVGGLDRTEKYYFEIQQNNSSGAFKRMTHDNGRTTERIGTELGISGYINTISTACSSGANAIMQAARLIESNKMDRIIAGGSDPLAVFNMKGFSSLNIYDPDICKPFDRSRRGLNLGEGAAFLVLENDTSISYSGNTPICILSGWDNAADAYHQTASSPEGLGAYLAMKNALAKAKISPDKISYVNAHGTGTGNNDLSESLALQKIFGHSIPLFSSSKGFTGHTLAAAGAIEAVFSVLSLQSQVIIPNLNFSEPMQETGMEPETYFRTDVAVDYVLSNSFGFGGNCTCLIFKKSQ